jgi:hypothetical protein
MEQPTKLVDRAKSKFRRGMGLHSEGLDRPDEYSPEQIGWDAAEEIQKTKTEFLVKAVMAFGNDKGANQ